MTKETREAIIAHYRAGASLLEVARQVSYSHETVRQVLRQSSEPIRPHGVRTGDRSHPEWWSEAARRYQEGASLRQVARAIGRCQTAVQRALVSLGVPRRATGATGVPCDTERMRALGKIGGTAKAARYRAAHYEAIGRKGAARRKELLALGKQREQEERQRLGLPEEKA